MEDIMKFKRPSRINSGIDMTPIIDVVFQLLAFFMITSTYIKTSAINVDLPKSKTSDVQPIREAVITLYKNGGITINEQPISLLDLGVKIKELYIKDKDIVVTIRGDKGVSYGTMIETMDIVRLAGVKRLSLATIAKD